MDQMNQDLSPLGALAQRLSSKLDAVQMNLALESMKQTSSQDEFELNALKQEKINLQYKIAFAKVMASGPNHS